MLTAPPAACAPAVAASAPAHSRPAAPPRSRARPRRGCAGFGDVEVGDALIARDVVVSERAAEALPGRERRAPAARLVVVDRPRHVRRDGLRVNRRERHDEVDGDVARLQRRRDLDRVVAALRMADEGEGADLSGGAVAQEVVDDVRPIEMLAHLDVEAFGLELVGELVEAVGEQAEIAAQQDDPVLGGDAQRGTRRGQRGDESDPAPAMQPCGKPASGIAVPPPRPPTCAPLDPRSSPPRSHGHEM